MVVLGVSGGDDGDDGDGWWLVDGSAGGEWWWCEDGGECEAAISVSALDIKSCMCISMCVCESVYACVWTQKRLCIHLCMHVCMHVYFHGLHLMLKGYMENTGCKGDSNAEKLDTGAAMKHS